MMLVGILLPEFTTALALDDWIIARLVTSNILSQAGEDDVPWSQAHSFAANMGVFMIKFLDQGQVTLEQTHSRTGI